MAAPYSLDLRERAVRAAQEAGMTRAEVARQFDIAEATLYGWIRRQKTEGTLAPRPHGGGQRPKLDEPAMEQLAEMVEEKNDRTLEEYQHEVQERLGVQMSITSVHRALEKLRRPRKKDVARRRARPSRRTEEAYRLP
jgi:transposase